MGVAQPVRRPPRHGCGVSGAVPVLDPRRRPDDVAGIDALFLTAPLLDPVASGGDDEGLSTGVGVPGRACAGVNETSAEPKVRTPLGSKSGLTLTSPVKVCAGPTAAGRESFGEISTVGSAFGSSACAEVALSRLSETLAATIANVLTSLMKLLAVVGGRLRRRRHNSFSMVMGRSVMRFPVAL